MDYSIVDSLRFRSRRDTDTATRGQVKILSFIKPRRKVERFVVFFAISNLRYCLNYHCFNRHENDLFCSSRNSLHFLFRRHFRTVLNESRTHFLEEFRRDPGRQPRRWNAYHLFLKLSKFRPIERLVEGRIYLFD